MLPDELQGVKTQLNAVCNAVEIGFSGLKTELRYVSRFNTVAIVIALLALFMATLTIVIAIENRALIMNLNQRQAQIERTETPPASPVPTR
jgi:hypothetical protein